MANLNLPPQAYTKEILAQAFEWLKAQPSSVRELATNADNLVSLFMASLRRSPDSVRPSNQAFKSDLKNLANDLKQFEEPRVTASPHLVHPAPVTPQAPATPVVPAASVPQSILAAPSGNYPSVTPREREHLVDSRTRELLAEVQNRFNLSSENEALRLLVALGYERLEQALPREKPCQK